MPPTSPLTQKLLAFINAKWGPPLYKVEDCAGLGRGTLSRLALGQRNASEGVILKVLTGAARQSPRTARATLARWKAEEALAALPVAMAADLLPRRYGDDTREAEALCTASAAVIDRQLARLAHDHPVLFAGHPVSGLGAEEKRRLVLAYRLGCSRSNS